MGTKILKMEVKMELVRLKDARNRDQESGAALVTVLLIGFLLLTASIALLSGVAAGTRNGTDML